MTEVRTFRCRRRLLYTAGLAAVLVSGQIFAAVRITEGIFFGCFYGNRGGACTFEDADGMKQTIGMPVHDEPRVKWVIDGADIGYAPVDGGFLVPDHPAFAEDHAPRYAASDHPLKGCPVKLIERPGETRFILETSNCRQPE